MSYQRTSVIDELNQIAGGTPSAIILDTPNPLDENTPVGVPLQVCGWGVNAQHIEYKTVVGWDQISETEPDEYFILSHVGHDKSVRHHVIRVSHPHARLMATSRFVDEAAIDAICYQLPGLDEKEWEDE